MWMGARSIIAYFYVIWGDELDERPFANFFRGHQAPGLSLMPIWASDSSIKVIRNYGWIPVHGLIGILKSTFSSEGPRATDSYLLASSLRLSNLLLLYILHIWRFPEMGGTPKSFILMGFSLKTIHLGYPHLWKPPYCPSPIPFFMVQLPAPCGTSRLSISLATRLTIDNLLKTA